MVDQVADWELDDMEWDETTGLATFVYERTVLGLTETKTVVRQQPCTFNHLGWSALWNVKQGTFGIR